MARSFSSSIATFLIVGLVLVAPAVEAQLSCPRTVGYIAPCLPYLTGVGMAPPTPCCDGVKRLNSAAVGTPARQAACICLKSAVARIPRLIGARITSLPGRCGVRLPFTVSPTTDCSKVT